MCGGAFYGAFYGVFYGASGSLQTQCKKGVRGLSLPSSRNFLGRNDFDFVISHHLEIFWDEMTLILSIIPSSRNFIPKNFGNFCNRHVTISKVKHVLGPAHSQRRQFYGNEKP